MLVQCGVISGIVKMNMYFEHCTAVLSGLNWNIVLQYLTLFLTHNPSDQKGFNDVIYCLCTRFYTTIIVICLTPNCVTYSNCQLLAKGEQLLIVYFSTDLSTATIMYLVHFPFMFQNVEPDQLPNTSCMFHGVGWRQLNKALFQGFQLPTTDFMKRVMCLEHPH